MSDLKKGKSDTLSRQNLKAALWYTVTKLVEEEELSLGITASEHFTAVLAEMVYQQALTLGKDLENFAKHANRSTIQVEDVKLVVRNNEPLFQLLSSEAVQHGLSLSDLQTKARPKPPRPKPITAASKRAVSTTINGSGKGKGKGKVKKEGGETDEDEDREDVREQSEEEEEPVRKKPKPLRKTAPKVLSD